MNAASLQTDALITQYVHIVNDAIGRDDSALPLERITEMADGWKAGLAIYKSDKENPGSYFTLGWREGKLEVAHEGKEKERAYWSMPRTHLEHVVENPEPFLNNPAKLDLDWLTRRMGIA